MTKPGAGSPVPANINYHGAIGIGSWNTSVDYKDIIVTRDGAVLYRSDFAAEGTNGWHVHSGDWSVQDGVYRQARAFNPGIATAGETNWSNYTLELKARKTGGDEGFLIFFNWLDDANFHCFNIGGWQNTESALQHCVGGKVTTGASVAQNIQTNVWYDIRVVVTGSSIECYVNSVLISTTSFSAPANSGRHGAIGVGAWRTATEYRDIVVSGNGAALYRSDFETQGTSGWQLFTGDWSVDAGVLRQTASLNDCRAITGDKDWANYTLTLKARKTGGDEGFLILFNWLDNDNWTWFNIGGWSNTASAVEQDLNGTRMFLGEQVPQTIESGVWYDIRVVVNGPQILCYVNSNLVQAVYAATVISTNAVYVGGSTTPDNHVLQFQIGGDTFQGLLPKDRGNPPELEKGSLVQVNGIARLLKRPAGAHSDSDTAFEMLLSSPGDVVLLQTPPWLNRQRLFLIGGILFAVLILGATWIAMISNRNRLLKLAHLQLQKANEELEIRVAHRTSDLAKANADLSHEQDLFRTLLDNASDHIYFKDASSRFVRCSLSLCSRSGLTHEQIIGKTDFEIFLEEHARLAFEDEQQIIRTGQPLIGKLEKETHSDGRATWVMTTKMPWRDSEGRIIGTFGISRDITAIKETEARLAQVHQQLVDASRTAGQAEVAASVLHNVGNVLNSVNVSAGIIRNRVRAAQAGSGASRAAELLVSHQDDLPAFFTHDSRAGKLPLYLKALAEQIASEQTGLLSEIDSLAKNIEHIKEIVSMQQNYARVAGVMELHSLPGLFEDALQLHAAALEKQQARVVLQFDPVPDILVDKHRVLQILVNLISNARWALSQTSAPEQTLTLGVHRNGDKLLRASVADNGIGIPPENLKRIFTHGFTTRPDGHGFGLHSAILAARELGGNLLVQSEGAGHGAIFTLELPCRT